MDDLAANVSLCVTVTVVLVVLVVVVVALLRAVGKLEKRVRLRTYVIVCSVWSDLIYRERMRSVVRL